MKIKRHGRYEFSAIHDRADYDWPDGKRLAVYLGMNLEVFSFGEGTGCGTRTRRTATRHPQFRLAGLRQQGGRTAHACTV